MQGGSFEEDLLLVGAGGEEGEVAGELCRANVETVEAVGEVVGGERGGAAVVADLVVAVVVGARDRDGREIELPVGRRDRGLGPGQTDERGVDSAEVLVEDLGGVTGDVDADEEHLRVAARP